jgi:hypothetical protein
VKIALLLGQTYMGKGLEALSVLMQKAGSDSSPTAAATPLQLGDTLTLTPDQLLMPIEGVDSRTLERWWPVRASFRMA